MSLPPKLIIGGVHYYYANWLLVGYTKSSFLVYTKDSSEIGWTFILMLLDRVGLSLLCGVSHHVETRVNRWCQCYVGVC